MEPMTDHTPWPWSESLAGLRSADGRWYRIRRILFGIVQDRCSELGIREGQVVRRGRRDQHTVEVQLSSGEVCTLELPCAWFIEVEPAAGLAEALNH